MNLNSANTGTLKRSVLCVFVLLVFYAGTTPGYCQKIQRTAVSAQDHAQNFVQLPSGFYWYGNSSGLHRFDGQQSTRYTVKDANSGITHDQYVASKVFLDGNDKYWFTTYQALHSLDPLTGEFTTFSLSHKGEKIEVANTVFFSDSIQSEILVKADTSIFSFNTEDFTYRLLKTGTRSNTLHPVRAHGATVFYGSPWWNANGIEYFEYSSGGIIDFQHIDLPLMVKAIAPLTKDSLYLATPEGLQLLIHPLDDAKRKLIMVSPGEIRTLAGCKKTGSIYFSVAQQGVFRFSPATNSITGHWNIDSSLSGNDARTLAVDEDGNVFVSHMTDGVDIIVVNDDRFSFTELPDDSEVSDMAPLANGDILIMNKLGDIYRKSGNSLIASRQSQKSIAGMTKPLISVASSGDVLAHGMSALAVMNDQGELKSVTKTMPSLYRGAISFTDGEILYLSSEGIKSTRMDEPAGFLSGIPHGPNDYFSYLIKLSEDRFLASHRQVAIWDFKKTPGGWTVASKVSVSGETQTAVIHEDKLFLGTSAGLLLHEQDTVTGVFNPTSTTGNLWVNALHKDDKNRLWLGTEQGLFCYYPETGDHLFFSEADGIPDDWFIRANVVATDSTFTMATKTGLVTVDTRLADATTSDNKIYLSDIWVNGIRSTDHSLYDPQPLDLDYQHNAVSFLTGMIELSSSELSGFRYKLEGLEEEYTYSKAGEVIRYPSIPPGDYSFEFVGVDKNGRTTEAISLPVSISPPFYQTWWFWSICAVSVLAAFYALNRRAIKKETARQQSIQKEQARKAAETLARHQAVVSEQRRIMMELHDDLSGTLGNLFYTLDGYLLDQESGLPVEPDFATLKNVSGDAMKQLREVMKNNVAREMPLPVFVRTLTEQARAAAAAGRIGWELEKDNSFPDLQLSSQQVHNALLIVKEGLQNIRKHSRATTFTLAVHLESEPRNTLRITLADNGEGLIAENPEQRTDGTGNGLHNMHRRAADLDGELSLTSPPEGGTHLQLKFPMK